MKLTWIGGGYQISDSDAGKLAKAAGVKLPRHGWYVEVFMPFGEKVVLQRTSITNTVYNSTMKFPSRGWVWMIMGDNLSRYKVSLQKNQKALNKAKQAALYAVRMEKQYWNNYSGNFKKANEVHDAYLVAADAYEDAGDLLASKRYTLAAYKIKDNKFTGELNRHKRELRKPHDEQRDPSHKRFHTQGRHSQRRQTKRRR